MTYIKHNQCLVTNSFKFCAIEFYILKRKIDLQLIIQNNQQKFNKIRVVQKKFVQNRKKLLFFSAFYLYVVL